MLVNCDVKGLELHTAAFLSQDEVLMQELWDEFDLHTDNQQKFVLPTRTIAKFLIFRILFGGSANGFYYDPDFAEVGYTKKQWQGVVDAFYEKYQGIAKWHTHLIQTALTKGEIVMPTGRLFKFKQWPDAYGNMKWPETQIKNFPVQSLGADVMTLYRILVARMMREYRLISKLISSVHDSLVSDGPEKEVPRMVQIMERAAAQVPKFFEESFGAKFNLPFRVEVQKGMDMKNMVEFA